MFATILGAGSFPTVGSEQLGGLPEAAVMATAEAITRSFLARRIVCEGDDGAAALCPPLDELMDIAVFPDLTVSVERLGADGVARWWFGLRPDRAVRVTVLPDGTRECVEVEPGSAIAGVPALAGAGTGGSTGSGPVRVELADVTAGDGPVTAVVRIGTAWRDGAQLHGGQLTWALGPHGASWLAEPRLDEQVPGWDLDPTDLDGLRANLLDHLPGGADG